MITYTEVQQMLTQTTGERVLTAEEGDMILALPTQTPFPQSLVYRSTMLAYGKPVALERMSMMRIGPFAIALLPEDWQAILVDYAKAFVACSTITAQSHRALTKREITEALMSVLRMRPADRFRAEVFVNGFVMEGIEKNLLRENAGQYQRT